MIKNIAQNLFIFVVIGLLVVLTLITAGTTNAEHGWFLSGSLFGLFLTIFLYVFSNTKE